MTVEWTQLLTRLAEGEDLERVDTAAAMEEVLAGKADPVVLGALLMGLRVKGESDDEILGFADAMLAAAEPLSVPAGTVDIVGTGGSKQRQSHAINVSTMASFVAAAAGATICKHGNVKASSTSGSFDFLTAVGVDINKTPAEVESQLIEHSIAFAWARTFHPAMRHAGPVRSALGLPTVFNILGPLVHPGRVKRVVLGAADPDRAEQLARVLDSRQMERAWVVAGYEGLDELSTAGPNLIYEVGPAGVSNFVVDPAELDVDLAHAEDLRGGTGEDNAEIFKAMVSAGSESRSPVVTAATNIVVLNAGAALVVAGQDETLAGGIQSAWDALNTGRVQALFTAFTKPA